MALILALDTTSASGGLVLLDGEQLLEVVPLDAPEGHAHILFGEIDNLLHRHGKSLDEVACFAAASGPGSFTGVRIGLAAMKGLAEATGRPVAAVSTLKALAWFGSARMRAVVLDARRSDVFTAVYDASLELVQDEKVNQFADWIVDLPDDIIEFVSPDFAPYRSLLAGTRFEGAAVVETPRSVVVPVARIAARLESEGKLEDPVTVDANYVRIADAERKWKERAR